ncbi:CarboxypepD_reg-like domain-containing protein [Pustulibacterium marinum]|uniref:CarboxypepD_reg-like domain-containing protein n=1 Tax=Pustulibacterium marinum TaxID=1224947 RepID=A0A1I7I7E5_9FLAO|nr:carboxypeptidase-like regulatory domain-containing protein [Pustulibacterium marinum]SFU68784.1 CarboxypepD_reg-like domain-containing protein [Pustulibacterium marinum]
MSLKAFACSIVCLFSVFILKAETITGYVFDKATEQPIQGVAVYFDGTSLGTVTNSKGYFSLTTPYKLSSDLIVSYMGYETLLISNPYEAKTFKIYLRETSFGLDEVVLQADPFSREEKLEVFKKQFLGSSYKNQCTIENEDAIVVTYNMKSHKLIAFAKEPLQIKNGYLAYDVSYNLVGFSADYYRNSLSEFQLKSVYFAGTSFFKDVGNNESKYDRRRKNSYLGSSLHLIRTLIRSEDLKQGLKRADFTLYQNRLAVKKPEDYLAIKDTLGGTQLVSTKKKYDILYGRQQSFLEIESDTIYIDRNGNFSPIQGLLFGGYMGTLRFKDMLPLDYELPEKD